MSNKRPGIFDPWRIRETRPAIRQSWTDEARAPDDDTTGTRCVSFRGKKAGVNVWVPANLDSEAAEARARSLIVDAVHSISRNSAHKETLKRHGVFVGHTGTGVKIVSEGAAAIIVDPGMSAEQDETAVVADKLSLALREIAAKDKNVSASLYQNNIRPYLKG